MHKYIYPHLPGNFYTYLIIDHNPIGTEKYYFGSATRIQLKERNIKPDEDLYFGSSSVEYLKILQDSRSPQLERIVIDTFDNQRECRVVEYHLINDNNAVRSSLFYNLSLPCPDFITTVQSTANTHKTKSKVGPDGLTIYQRSGAKIAKIKREKLINDEDMFSIAAKKSIDTKNKTIINGLNTHKRAADKSVDTKNKNIINGLNTFQRLYQDTLIHKTGINSQEARESSRLGLIEYYKSGGENSNKGKMAINNGINNRYINKTDTIPKGWCKGVAPKNLPKRMCINNGKIDRLIIKDDPIPLGWKRGRVSNKLEGTRWITNDSNNTRIKKNDSIPVGWRLGKTHK